MYINDRNKAKIQNKDLAKTMTLMSAEKYHKKLINKGKLNHRSRQIHSLAFLFMYIHSKLYTCNSCNMTTKILYMYEPYKGTVKERSVY